MKLNDFHAKNIARQHEAFAPAHGLFELLACVQEELGELAEASLGFMGVKKRKAHLTREEALKEAADAITYLSLVVGALGCKDLEGLLASTFNSVSFRAGSGIFVELEGTPRVWTSTFVVRLAAAMYHQSIGIPEISPDEAWKDADQDTRLEYAKLAGVAVNLFDHNVIALNEGPCICEANLLPKPEKEGTCPVCFGTVLHDDLDRG